jgi:hypothetical protein
LRIEKRVPALVFDGASAPKSRLNVSRKRPASTSLEAVDCRARAVMKSRYFLNRADDRRVLDGFSVRSRGSVAGDRLTTQREAEADDSGEKLMPGCPIVA